MATDSIAVQIEAPEGEALSAPLRPSFDYTRSTGPILGAFFAGLRERTLRGIRDNSGRVHVPPVEFDPTTHEALSASDIVDVAEEGEVVSWTWVSEPGASAALASPHALALIRPRGADTAMLHVVAAESAADISTGMRVEARWIPEPRGSIRDLYFVPAGSQVSPGLADYRGGLDDSDRLVTPVELDVTHTAGFAERTFLRGLAAGKIIGRRRSNGPEVYVPPRDWCPSDGVPMGEFVEVADTGVVTTFGIVNAAFAGQKITPPYVTAYILLDGSDLPIQHLVLGIPANEVRMGMRVRAHWVPESERVHSMASISHFEPTGEPDAPRGSFEKHL